MLMVLLHDICTLCTISSYETFVLFAQLHVTRHLYHLYNCKLRDWYNDITYCSRLCFQKSIVSVWISFLRISVDIAFWVSQQLMAFQLNRVVAFLNCEFDRHWRSPTAASNLQLGLWSSTWTHTFICRDCQVFTTAKLLLNNVLYHTIIQH